MGLTKIEWADYTFNPWIGCAKVSPGCANCYAERDFAIRRKRVIWGPAGTRDKTSAGYWRQPLRWNQLAASGVADAASVGNSDAGSVRHVADAASIGAADAGSVHHVRPRVFCGSLCDVFEQFDNDPRPLWRAQLFDLIEQTPHLDWLLLTKRPQNVLRMLCEVKVSYGWGNAVALAARWLAGEPPANVWLGTSVENQACADERIPELLKIPAAVRFLSVEPLLGSIDLRRIPSTALEPQWRIEALTGREHYDRSTRVGVYRGLDWIIAGGESGPHARPMHPAWPRSLRDQCAAAAVPFFFKQWGEYIPDQQQCPLVPEGYHCVPEIAEHDGEAWGVFRVGKHAAGRLLDGREWNDVPSPRRCTLHAPLSTTPDSPAGTRALPK